MPKSPNLTVSVRRDYSEGNISQLSSPRSPQTAPIKPSSPHNNPQSFAEGYDLHSNSPITSLPKAPSPKQYKSRSFFSNSKGNRSASKITKNDSLSKLNTPTIPPSGGAMSQVYTMSRALGSSPELTLTGTNGEQVSNTGASTPEGSSLSTSVPLSAGVVNTGKKKEPKHKFSNLLGRKGSLRDEESPERTGKMASRKTSRYMEEGKGQRDNDRSRERNYREMLPSTPRTRSSDRQVDQESERYSSNHASNHGSFLHNIRSSGTRATDGIGRAGKGLLSKLSGRGGTSQEFSREDEKTAMDKMNKNYKVITLPLEDQTRRTRICKRLEDCKDKTEFWLPAVAYRCIDYLNDKGTTHEGLYRIPGSEREIREWAWRFDNDLDIDLLNEEELYDVNVISSMFKQWLRELPEEVFPKLSQQRIADAIAQMDSTLEGAPKILKTELSNLPPFNYYLLFAVTAHITMLLNASKENKMTFHNLCVCFMPALKVDMPCFTWLILDWKNCWEGCATEREYLEREYAILDGHDPQSGNKDMAESEGRSRPVQHFDRYPPPRPKQHSAPNVSEGSSIPSSRTRSTSGGNEHRSRHYSPARGQQASEPSIRKVEPIRPPRPEGSGSSGVESSLVNDRPATSPITASAAQERYLAQANTKRDRDKSRLTPLLQSGSASPSGISRTRRGSEPAEKIRLAPDVATALDLSLGLSTPRGDGKKRRPKATSSSSDPPQTLSEERGPRAHGEEENKGKESGKSPSINEPKGSHVAIVPPELSPVKPLSPFGL